MSQETAIRSRPPDLVYPLKDDGEFFACILPIYIKFWAGLATRNKKLKVAQAFTSNA
jgi:hypothetical protein